MQFLRKHWLAVLAILPNLPWIWNQFVRLLDWGTRFDFIINKLHEAGGVSGLIAFLLNPPAWSIWVTVIGGLLLIYWDARWQHSEQRSGALNAVREPTKAPIIQFTPAPIADATTATPKPLTLPEKPRRKFVDAHVTPEFLVGLHKGNTALRAETLISEQKDKWMLVSGPLGEIHPGTVMFNGERSPTLVVFAFRKEKEPQVYMWFSGEWIDRLALLPKNINISVVGQIKKVVGYDLR